jgi:6-phosphofructokinase 1
VEITPEEIAEALRIAYEKGKAHAIVVVAEGAKYPIQVLNQYFIDHKERLGFDLRITTLGHVQRGGNPGAFDRILATKLGAGAIDAMARGETGVLVGQIKNEVKATPLDVVTSNKKTVDLKLLELAKLLD